MTLTAFRGSYSAVNTALLLYAAENTPSLILDCSNCANPHKLFPAVQEDKLTNMFVVNIDIIYKLRDTLKTTNTMAQSVGAKHIIITIFNELFDYDNKEENLEIFKHSWELITQLSDKYKVIVGVQRGTLHEEFAQKYCSIYDMDV